MERSGIRFASSSDGTKVAFWSLGDGPPLVLIHNFSISHAELEWEIPSMRSFYEALARHHQVIRLDPRATGLSGGDYPEDEERDSRFLDDVIADVECVVDATGHSQFDLIASVTMGSVGIRLGTTGRVGRLVLCNPVVDVLEAQAFHRYLRAAEAMAEVDPSQSVHMMSRLWTDVAPPEDRDPLNSLIEENGSRAERWKPLSWNAVPLLADVSAPTLVVYAKADPVTSMDQVRQAAATIPDARLVGVEGRLGLPYWMDREGLIAALGDFLGWGSTPERVSSAFSVIVFTDVVASAEVVDRLGDHAARDAIRSIEELVAATAADRSGRVIKHLGDGSLLEFRSASDALDFAHEIQTELSDGDVGLRVGMAAGEPIHEDGDVHGAVVVVASRIADAATAGEVFVSDGVRQLVVGKDYAFTDRGSHSIRGFEEPLRIWQLSR